MRRTRFLHVAVEGWPFVGLVFLLGVLSAVILGLWWALPFLVVIGVLGAFFYDRKRPVPSGSLMVTAPVDGKIIHRRECYDPYLDREAIRLTFEISFFGAYFLRSPVVGTVREMPASACPEFSGPVSWIRTNDDYDLVLTVSEGCLFGARPFQTSYGERIGQGRPCGQRRLARRLDIYLPPNSRIEVVPGDAVRAGRDVIARFVRKRETEAAL